MKKFFALLSLVFILQFSVNAQTSPLAADRLKQAGEETKSQLVSKLGLSEKAASKIVQIENEFFQKLTDVEAQANLKLQEKEVKLNQAHVARRNALTKVPLEPRQMEDAIAISEQVRHKYKL